MINGILKIAQEPKKPKNPVLQAIENQTKPLPAPKPKRVEPLLKGLPSQDKADIEARVKKNQDAQRAKAEAESKVVRKRAIYTSFGWAEAEIAGPMTPEKLQAARDEIEADQIAQGNKPTRKLERVGKDIGKDLYNESDVLAKFAADLGNQTATRLGFGEDSPLNSKPVKKLLSGIRKVSDVKAMQMGEDIKSVASKVGYQGEQLKQLGETPQFYNENLGPSGALGQASNIFDETKSPMERAMGAGMTAASIAGAAGTASKVLLKSGLLSAEKKLAGSVASNAIEDLPIIGNKPAELGVDLSQVGINASGNTRVMPKPKQVPPAKGPGLPEANIQPGVVAEGGDSLGNIKAGARKSIQSELRPGGEIADEALQKYIGPTEAIQKGKELFDSGADMHGLANALATTPRAIKPEETTALLHHIGKLVDQRAGLKSLEATLKPEEYLAQFDKLNGDIQTAYDAIRKGGREASASLNSLRTVLRDDMSMDTGADLIRKVSDGAEPTSDQMKALQDIETRYNQLSSQLDHVNTKLDEASQEIARLKSTRSGKISATTRKAHGQAKFDSGLKDFKELWDKLHSVEDGTTRLGSGFGLTTEEMIQISKHVHQMVRGLVDVGIGNAQQIFETTAKHLSELTGRNVSPDDVSAMYDHASGQSRNRMKVLTELEADIAYAKKSGALESQKRVNLLSKQAQELENEIKLARSERNKIVRDASSPGVAEKANGFLNTLQLTDPIARAIDFTANTVKLAGYAIETPIRKVVNSGVNKIGKAAMVDPGAGSPFTKIGRDRFKRVFEGYGTSLGERFGSESTHNKYGISTGGKFTNAGYKFAGFSDAPAKELYYRMHLDSQAEGMARAELGAKATPQAINARTRYYTAKATRSMKQAAEDFADLQTFNSKSALQKVSKAIADTGLDYGGKAGQTLGRQSTRFWNVMANVAQDRIERTAIGSTVGSAHEIVKLRKAFIEAGIVDPVAAHKLASLVAKGSTGAAIYQAGKYLHSKYGGFSEIKRNEKGGSAWIDNGIWDQIGGPMSQFLAGANEAEIEKNGGSEKAALRFKANVNMLFSQPMFTQSENLSKIFNARSPEEASKVAGGLLGNYFVPSAVRRAAKAFDENDPNGTWLDKVTQGRPVDTKVKNDQNKTDLMATFLNDAFFKNLPFYRNRLPTKPIVKGGKP